jgi:hypothetical protein
MSHVPVAWQCPGWNIHTYIHCTSDLNNRRCPDIYLSRDQLLPSIYPRLRNRCLAINNSSLLVSADISHVPVAWQCPGWNIHTYIHSTSDLNTRRYPGIYLSRDQLLPPIYPRLRNRRLAINNSSLLVSADISHVPLPGNGQAGTYIFPQIFGPFGQNAIFLPAYTLPYTYTIR